MPKIEYKHSRSRKHSYVFFFLLVISLLSIFLQGRIYFTQRQCMVQTGIEGVKCEGVFFISCAQTDTDAENAELGYTTDPINQARMFAAAIGVISLFLLLSLSIYLWRKSNFNQNGILIFYSLFLFLHFLIFYEFIPFALKQNFDASAAYVFYH